MEGDQENEFSQDRLEDNVKYILFFYRYLFKEKSMEILASGVLNFGIGLLPLILVYLFEIHNLTDEFKRQFFW